MEINKPHWPVSRSLRRPTGLYSLNAKTVMIPTIPTAMAMHVEARELDCPDSVKLTMSVAMSLKSLVYSQISFLSAGQYVTCERCCDRREKCAKRSTEIRSFEAVRKRRLSHLNRYQKRSNGWTNSINTKLFCSAS